MNRKSAFVRWVCGGLGMVCVPWVCFVALNIVGVIFLIGGSLDNLLKLRVTFCLSVLSGVPFALLLPVSEGKRLARYLLAGGYMVLAGLGMASVILLLIAAACARGPACM